MRQDISAADFVHRVTLPVTATGNHRFFDSRPIRTRKMMPTMTRAGPMQKKHTIQHRTCPGGLQCNVSLALQPAKTVYTAALHLSRELAEVLEQLPDHFSRRALGAEVFSREFVIPRVTRYPDGSDAFARSLRVWLRWQLVACKAMGFRTNCFLRLDRSPLARTPARSSRHISAI